MAAGESCFFVSCGSNRAVPARHEMECLNCHVPNTRGVNKVDCRWYPSMPCSRSQGVVSQHTLQVFRPTSRGEVEGSGLGGLQAHTRGFYRPMPGGSPSPHLGGGTAGPHLGVSRPTIGVYRPTPEGSSGPDLGVSRPTPSGCIPACTEADPPDGYCCR